MHRLKRVWTGANRLLWRHCLRHWLFLLFLSSLAFGFFGFLRANAAVCNHGLDAWLDSAYRTLQMFGLNFDLPQGPGGEVAPINGFIHVSRILAAIVAFGAVLSVFFQSFFDWIALRFQSFLVPHRRYLLLGFGEINRAFASELRARRSWVWITAVDRNVDAVDRRIARDLGIRLIEADLSDPQTLRRIFPDRAARVIVAAGEDQQTVEIAASIAPIVEAGLHRRGGMAPWWVIQTVRRGITRGVAALARSVEADPPRRPFGEDLDGRHLLTAHVGDLRLMADLIEAQDLSYRHVSGFRPFNVKLEAARALVRQARFIQKARDAGQRRVHLVLLGMGAQGEALLTEALMSSTAADLAPPKITVLDLDHQAVEERLRAHYPRLMDNTLSGIDSKARCEGWEPVTVRPFNVAQTDFTRCAILDELDDSADPPTAWIFACGGDRVNQSAAIRLELAMRQRCRKPAPIHVRLWGAGLRPGSSERPNPFGLIRTFGDIERTIAAALILEPEVETWARRIHEAYQTWTQPAAATTPVQPNISPFRDRWLALSEMNREANRRVARNLPLKLAELGLDWRTHFSGRADQTDLVPSVPVIGPVKDALDGIARLRRSQEPFVPEADVADDPLARFAVVEHMLWMIERVRNGWVPGPRDNLRRRHDKIAPMHRLDGQTQGYDLSALGMVIEKQGAPEEAAQAKLRHVVSLNLSDATPLPAGMDRATVLKLIYRAGGGAVSEPVRLAVESWSRKAHACRLHLVLVDPVEVPLSEKDRVAVWLDALITHLPPQIEVELTALWPRDR